MCGRTACTLAPDEIRRACRQRNGNGAWTKPRWRDPPGGQQYYPSYNLAPSAHSPVLISGKHAKGDGQMETGIDEPCDLVIQPMQWGLVPRWHHGSDAASFGYKMNNARSDGMMTKASFKKPLESGQRCVILVDGYFEWKEIAGGKKQPYFIYFPQDTYAKLIPVQDNKITAEFKERAKDPKSNDADNSGNVDQENCVKQMKEDIDTESNEEFHKGDKKTVTINVSCEEISDHEEWTGRKLLTMAGLFDTWKPHDSADPLLYSYSVITVDAHPSLAWIHERMPAILTSDEEIRQWLDCSQPAKDVIHLIRPTNTVTCHPVSSLVNNSRNKSPECVVPCNISTESPAGAKKTAKLSAESSFMKSWLTPGKRKTGPEASCDVVVEEKKPKIE